ncbi:hypothetical protein MKEN_00123600 [Mycena kentingensis (nom. inval.)]|nr:hypothetical protein MKEN_00123600 [Mycena kentingensis (nom. inval.)]
MKFSATLATLSLVAISVAHELPSRYAAARRGDQFVTGPCAKDSDCQQGCCAFNTGKCAGPAVAQTRDGGCGFGSPAPNCNVAKALGLSDCVAGAVNGDLSDPDVQAGAAFSAKLNGIAFTPKTGGGAAPPPQNNAAAPAAGGNSVAELAASQQSKKTVFEACGADSECQQGCCGFTTGKCAGPAVAQTNGSGGCGKGTAAPNCNVATLLGFPGTCISGFKNGDLNDRTVQAATAFSAQLNGIAFTPSVGGGAAAPPRTEQRRRTPGRSKKTVFEACGADSECQQGCCGFNSGKCAGPAVAQTNGSGGCGRGTAAPNCNVATLLGFPGTCISGFKNGDLKNAQVQAATAFSAKLNGIAFTPA